MPEIPECLKRRRRLFLLATPAAVASPQKRARAGAAAEEETVAEMLGVACKGMKSKYENWENIMSTTVDTVTDFAGLDW